jgi:hypothetical protein
MRSWRFFSPGSVFGREDPKVLVSHLLKTSGDQEALLNLATLSTPYLGHKAFRGTAILASSLGSIHLRG